MSSPIESRVTVNGVSLCYFEWNVARKSQSGQPQYLLLHATGFHARCWDQVVRHLDGYIVAVDMRGHGRSGNNGPFTWDTFGLDVAELVSALRLTRVVGGGHSMGGHSLTQAAAMRPEVFERLVLIDPVIMAPDMYAQRSAFQGVNRPEEHPTSKRRNHWRDAEEMFERFRDRMPFSGWQIEVLHDYCQWGVVPSLDGEGLVLGCPPIVEASIYMGSAGRDIFGMIAEVDVPVTVLRGKQRDGERQGVMDFSSSPTWPELATRFRHGRDVYLPEHSHFIPMEAAELVADYLLGKR